MEAGRTVTPTMEIQMRIMSERFNIATRFCTRNFLVVKSNRFFTNVKLFDQVPVNLHLRERRLLSHTGLIRLPRDRTMSPIELAYMGIHGREPNPAKKSAGICVDAESLACPRLIAVSSDGNVLPVTVNHEEGRMNHKDTKTQRRESNLSTNYTDGHR